MKIHEIERFSPNQWYYDLRDQLKRHIYDRANQAFVAGDAARDAIQAVSELDARKATMHSAFIDCIGGLPACDTPLNSSVVGTIECDGFRIEKVIFESRPKCFVTANLYVPDGIISPRGAVLFVCGHHEQAKHEDEYQIVCRYLVKAGLVVLAQDPIGQGERFSYFEKSLNSTTMDWGVPEHDYAGCQCWPLGDGIARYFVHDGMRGIDYLCTRPEVDPNKIGVTGNSGGGTQTSMLMICDPRIAASAPCTFIMNRQTYMHAGGPQDSEQIWPGMTVLGFDHEDILLMMTPKPVRVLAVTYDFFPIEGTRRTVERCKRLWEMYGKAGNIDMIEDISTHIYTRKLAKSAAEFFALHLLRKEISPEDDDIQSIAPSKLWCTSSGQVRAEMDDTRFVYEENQDRLTGLINRREALPETDRKERAVSWLRERVFANRRPCEFNPRHYHVEQVQNLTAEACFWWSQEDLMNYAVTFRDYRFAENNLPVTLALWDGGTNSVKAHSRWIRKICESGRAVMALDVSGAGVLQPHSFPGSFDPLSFLGVVFKLADELMWLNDSLAAMRTYDILRALDMIDIWPGLQSDDTRIYAHGNYGVYGQLASLLDSRIVGVDSVDGIESYAEFVKSRYYDSDDIMSVIMPGILNYLDLPDIEKWR